MCHRSRFSIELTALGQESILFEVFCMEQLSCTCRSTAGQDWRINFLIVIFKEEVISASDDLVSDIHYRMLFTGPQPQMAVVHKELRSVVFGSNRITFRLMDDFDGGDFH